MTQKWKVLTLLNVALVAGDLLVYPKSDPFFLLGDFFDEEANFGIDIPEKGISTGVVVASPDHGCGPAGILPPPNVPNPPNHWAVLIRRYNCSFEEKVLNAQNAFYDVAIIHNVNSNALEIMNASHPELIHIMAVFISANSGKEIRTRYLYEQGFIVQIEPNSAGHILGKILIPFIVVISACFVLMVGFMVLKCIKDHRRACRRRMPHSALDKIPTTKYRKNDPYETCAICLDDFVEGEKLRVLPCSHAYHSKCIDPWLTRNRRVCPMCKRKVFAADERVEDNGSSSEDDDHTPLLRGRNAPPRQGGLPAIRRLALQHPEMQTIGDVIRSFGLERERQEPQPGSWLEQSSSSDASSPSGSSSSSSNQSTGDRSWDQFQQVIQRILKNESEAEPHHEDHRGAPAHSQSPHPHGSADSAPQTEAQLHDPHGADFEDSTHHESHSVDSYHDDDHHHEVTFHDDSGHHDVAHDDTYDTHSLGC